MKGQSAGAIDDESQANGPRRALKRLGGPTHRAARPAGVVYRSTPRQAARPPRALIQAASWAGAVWTIVVAIDLFFLSNPIVFGISFNYSLTAACVASFTAALVTLAVLPLPCPPWTILLLLAFGALSASWSQNSSLTLNFVAHYVVISAVAVVVGSGVDVMVIASGALLGGVAVVLGSCYALAQNLPGAAVPLGTEGYLAGIGTNRNILAYTLVIALALGLGSTPNRWWSRLAWAIGVGTVLLGLFLAQSATGYVVAVVLVIVHCGVVVRATFFGDSYRLATSRRRLYIGSAVPLAVGLLALVFTFNRVAGHRNLATLSGRIPLWQAIWGATPGDERLRGAGWGAVWPHPWNPAPPNGLYANIISRTGVVLDHGHNAIMDLIPELGVLGAGCFMLIYFHLAVKALGALRPGSAYRYGNRPAATCLLGLIALVSFGITEPLSTIPLGFFTSSVLASLQLSHPSVESGRPERSPQNRSTLLSRHKAVRRDPRPT